jgi:hypothetical protein
LTTSRGPFIIIVVIVKVFAAFACLSRLRMGSCSSLLLGLWQLGIGQNAEEANDVGVVAK